ncbi:Kinesin-like protein Klp98A [Portunus trituberculatus]|uniref:Kinesin-like protein Klp98A n=1 Tax=Portunus trituberculatus TaxID=210409 RepID=A0A5B7ELN8_PORTR|nr:Kinesin-like protein Klp98A [Portunus trituberculatus]
MRWAARREKPFVYSHISLGDGAEARERVKEFTFDYSYWSHAESDHHFAPQVKIYDDLGTDVVSNALQGYNACVFAYGQTGSGKTFTMMGSQSNPGLIPRICEALFSSMAEGREAGTTYKVEVSYLEIYNERVKDLLRPGAQNTHSLRVREHPKLGPYVQDLSVHLVQQYPDIEANNEKGSIMETLSQKQAKEKELTDQWTERWSQGVVLDSERPHLVLIDDNVLTTGVTLYHLNDSLTTIGSLSSQDIRLE